MLFQQCHLEEEAELPHEFLQLNLVASQIGKLNDNLSQLSEGFLPGASQTELRFRRSCSRTARIERNE